MEIMKAVVQEDKKYFSHRKKRGKDLYRRRTENTPTLRLGKISQGSGEECFISTSS